MFSDFSVEAMSWKDSPLWLQTLDRSPYQLHVYDGIVFILAIWTVAWFTDCWGYRTPKPDPRLFVPVKDRTAFESQPGQSRNVADALKELDVVVFWGSQSGRAESLAAQFVRECGTRYGLRCRAADLDDYDHEHLTEVAPDKLLVFLISTFGQGDPPDNALKFCSALQTLHKRGSVDTLRNLRYAAFGLGNKNYKHFNKTVDDADAILQSLGSSRLGTLGRGDEARGNMSTQEDFEQWKDTLMERIQQEFGVEEKPMTYSPASEISAVSSDTQTVYLGEPAGHLEERERGGHRPVGNNAFVAPITVSKDFQCNEDAKCVYLEIDISTAFGVRYQTGDHLAVWPINPNVEVERLCRLLGLDGDSRKEVIAVVGKSGQPASFPTPTTREAVLRHYLEICGPVSRDTVRLLESFCPTEGARATLSKLINDKQTFQSQVSDRYLNVGQVMEAVGGAEPWKHLPFSWFVDCLSKMKPRYYSIASSPSVAPRHPSIAVSITSKVVDASKPLVRLNGVASNYLYSLRRDRGIEASKEFTSQESITYDLHGPRSMLSGGKMFVSLRRTLFKLPAVLTRPIIMVAAGTGVAPFRAFVQERAAMAVRGVPTGSMLLLFGCRSPTDGFLFGDEWDEFKSQHPRFEIHPAYSRHGGRKLYVQDLLVQLKDQVAGLLEQDAAFYICGSADMAREVRNRLVEIVAESRKWSEEQAERYVMTDMKKARLLQEDVWSN
ncbi:hypothetical protein LTS15_004293 [Exophiala xenobiotica]|nr:hypothetical protein LTS15_004293 [Exophiala xenobiotica]